MNILAKIFELTTSRLRGTHLTTNPLAQLCVSLLPTSHFSNGFKPRRVKEGVPKRPFSALPLDDVIGR